MNFQKPKYFGFYWAIAHEAAAQSVATRHKVGAVVVTLSGMISTGWNGQPSGIDNCCENVLVEDDDNPGKVRWKTAPTVIHAERNAIDKMTRQGVPTEGAVLFITRAPCLECGKALQGLGLSTVHYDENHDDMQGVELLRATGTMVIKRSTPVVTPPNGTPSKETYGLSA